MITTTNVALDNDHRMNGHDAMLPDCPRCRADAEALNMLHLMPPARRVFDRTSIPCNECDAEVGSACEPGCGTVR
jgi:hypothetical protein